jgi:hypothetical protein
MSLYSPKSATLSIHVVHWLGHAARWPAVQTAVRGCCCGAAARGGVIVTACRNSQFQAIFMSSTSAATGCHDSYVATPYRIFAELSRAWLTTLSF